MFDISDNGILILFEFSLKLFYTVAENLYDAFHFVCFLNRVMCMWLGISIHPI